MALFKPKWQTDNRAKLDKAVQAVGRVTDQATLADAALHAPLEEVRVAAAKKAEGQDVLERIVEESGEKPVIQAALHNLMMAYAGRLGDLERIACNPCMASDDILWILQAVKPEARQHIVRKHADDQDFLLQAALHAPGSGTQCAAVLRLTSYEALLQVAEKEVGAKAPALAAKRLAELYPDKAQEELERAIVRQIFNGFIKQAVELREQLGEPRDVRRFEREVVETLCRRWTSIQRESAREAVPLLQSLTREDSRFMLACNLCFLDTKRVAAATSKKGGESLSTVAFSLLTDGQLVRLAEGFPRLEKERTPEVVRAIRQCAFVELASRPNGQQILEGIVERSLDERNPAGLRFITDVPWLLELAKAEPHASVQRRLLDLAKSESVIVDILVNGLATREEVVAGSSASSGCDKDMVKLLKRVKNQATLERLAAEARDLYIRSAAARRLREDFGCADVSVLHDVCQYCGGKVNTSDPYAGTIESHLRWDCRRCGRFQDQTLYGPGSSNEISGDFYVFGEIEEGMDASTLVAEQPASIGVNGMGAPAAKPASTPAETPAGAGQMDSYQCKGCSTTVSFGPDTAEPCTCPNCGAENHRWHPAGDVVDYRDYSAGTRWDECSRCGGRKNFRTVNTM